MKIASIAKIFAVMALPVALAGCVSPRGEGPKFTAPKAAIPSQGVGF